MLRRNLGEEVHPPVQPVAHLDNASFIATIQDPQIRREILESMGENELEILPPHLIAEARGYR